MTAKQIKQILTAVEDEDEVMIGSYNGPPANIEYVQVFESGEIWISGNMVSVGEFSEVLTENKELKKQNKILLEESEK